MYNQISTLMCKILSEKFLDKSFHIEIFAKVHKIRDK
jgi:hypothetical protein